MNTAMWYIYVIATLIMAEQTTLNNKYSCSVLLILQQIQKLICRLAKNMKQNQKKIIEHMKEEQQKKTTCKTYVMIEDRTLIRQSYSKNILK